MGVHVVAMVGLTYLFRACPVPHLGSMNISAALFLDSIPQPGAFIEDLLSLICWFSQEASSIGSRFL